jgi:tRNA-dihydrouridine synthase
MVTTPEGDEPETIASLEGLREAGADEIVVHGRMPGQRKLAHAWAEKRRVCA